MQQSQCQRHSEQIIFIKTKESGERNQGLCAKCVVDKKKEFTLVQDVKNKIDEIKQEAQNISKELHEENIQQLKKIIEQIGSHKTQMVSAIDKIVNNLEQWIQFLEQGIVNYEQNLQSIEVIYMDQFLTELEEMDKKIYENNQTYKETILDQFQNLTKESQVQFNLIQQTFIILHLSIFSFPILCLDQLAHGLASQIIQLTFYQTQCKSSHSILLMITVLHPSKPFYSEYSTCMVSKKHLTRRDPNLIPKSHPQFLNPSFHS